MAKNLSQSEILSRLKQSSHHPNEIFIRNQHHQNVKITKQLPTNLYSPSIMSIFVRNENGIPL